jgi:hypothetical protein
METTEWWFQACMDDVGFVGRNRLVRLVLEAQMNEHARQAV